jgi:hypothetical protein
MKGSRQMRGGKEYESDKEKIKKKLRRNCQFDDE